jgi:hypothetical protein
LTVVVDDAIVVFPNDRFNAMLSKTTIAFQKHLEYTKAADGSWAAKFSGPIHVHVHDSSLERCRDLALDDLDTRLAAWLTAPEAGQNPSGLARPVLTRVRRPKIAASKKRAIAKSR